MANVPGRLPDGLDPADFGPAVPLGGGTPARSPMPRPAAGAVDSRLPEGLDPADFGPPVEQYRPVGMDVDSLRTSLNRSLGVQPDHAADIFKISRRTGLDVGTVERNLPEAKRADELARSAEGLDAFMQRNPKATAWLADPANFGLARDDLDALGGVEQAFMRNSAAPVDPEEVGGVGTSLLKTVKRTIPTVGSGLYDMYGLGAGGLDYIERGLGNLLGTGSTGVFGKGRDWFHSQSSLIADNILAQPGLSLPQSKQGRLWDNPRLLLDPEWLTFNVGDAANSMLPTIASLFISGGATAVPAVIGAAQEAGNLYRQLISEDKADPDKALSASLAYGVVVSQLEKLGLDKIMDKRVASTVAKRVAKATVAGATEGGTEHLEEPFQAFFQGIANNESPEQVTARVADALKNIDVIPGAFLLGGAGAYGNTAHEYHKAKAAQRMGKAFDEIGKFSSESKLNARLPEAYQDYVEHVRRETGGSVPEQIYVSAQRLAEAVVETGASGGDGSVQADAQVLAQFFQSIGVKPEEAQRMAALDQDVAIPFALYQSKIAPTDMGQSLANDLRFAHDGMTRNEAVQFEKEFQGRVQDELAAQEQNRVQHDADLAQAIGEYKDELARVGMKGKDADAQLQLLTSGANVAAARWSVIKGETITPAQWLRDMRGLQIRAVEQGQARQKADLEQGIAHAGADLAKPEQVAEAARLWETMGTESPYFKWWAKGKQIFRLFHGTSSDVEAFNRIDGGNMWGRGHYFTDSPSAASAYAEGDPSTMRGAAPSGNAAPNVMPLYVAMAKPFVMDAPLEKSTLAAVKEALGPENGKALKDYLSPNMRNRDLRQVIWQQFTGGMDTANGILLQAGFDGLIEGQNHMVFPAHETQIKSVFNRGTFDASDPRILHQPVNSGVDLDRMIPVVSLDGANLFGFGKKGANAFVEKWQGASLTFDGGKWRATLSSIDPDHAFWSSDLNRRYDTTRQAALAALDQIVNGAVLTETIPPKHAGVERTHRFYVPVSRNGNISVIRVTAHEMTGKALEVDGAEVYDVIKERRPAPQDKSLTEGEGMPKRGRQDAFDEITVRQMLSGVKDASGQLYVNGKLAQVDTQGSRGTIAFTNQGTFISLFKGSANRSTLPHEFAHLFVNDMQAMVATGKAPESVVRDLAVLEGYAGSLATVEAQEKLATAFEAYLREGKAPSPELRTAFQTFRAWLAAIYRDIRALVGPDGINDELRGVFDRMLASEDEIAQAEAYYGAKDALEKVAGAMLTDAEKKRIAELRGASHAAALEKRTQRYVSAYLKALGGKAEFERQAGEEVDARQVYRNVKDIAEQGGLPRAALDDQIGQAQAQALFLKFPGLVSPREASLFGSHDLDMIAVWHDYQGADAMVADFQKAMTRGEAVRNLAAEKMQAEEARLREALANETVPGDEDVHSDETLERLTTEARALERKIRADAGAKAAVSSPINATASREVARAVLETMTVADGRDYTRFAAAERRAGLEVAQAVKAQDWTKALGAKQRESINHALVLESVKLREEVTKELAFARRIGNSKSMRFEAKEQALSVIQAYGLGTEKMVPERPAELADLAGYLKAAFEGDLFNPFDAFPDWLLRKEKSGQYRNLSVADFREVAYLMRSLADVGGSAAIHMATEDVSYEAKAAELAGVVRNSGNVAAKHDEGTKQQKASHLFRSLMSTMQQQLDMFRKADGYVNLGPENSHLVGPNQELFERIQKSTARMLGMLQGHEPAMKEIAKVRQAFVDRFRKAYGERVAEVNGVAVPQIMQDNERYTWTAERIWTIARNIGNGGNRRCLIEGLGLEWSSIQQLLRVLTKDELLAVQREGKIIGSHYAEADKTFRQVYHRPMAQRIEYQPMTIQAADGPVQLDGWYFPIKPDAKLNQRAGDREGADIMKADASASAFPPNPRKSFTNARTGAAVPVALSFDVFERGLAEQTRFIALAPILKDADRVFRQEEYRRAYTDAFGREAYDEIRPWLKNIATPGMEQADAYDDILSKARRGATAFILIGNLKSALKQELGHLPAMKEMGTIWALRGMKALAVDGEMTVEAINAMDPRMKNREKGFDTEQRELLAKARNETVKLAFGKIDTPVTEHDVLKFGMTLQRLFDRHTTYSVWAGAFLKGRDGLNMTEQESIDYAYRMVERSQVTNTDAAMNYIQRSNSFIRPFSMFMSEALPKGSRIRVDFNAFKNGKLGAGEYARAVFYELIGPVLFNVVGLNLLASVAPDDPKEYFWSFWSELFGTIPILGGLSGYYLYGKGPAESAAFTGMDVQLKAAQKAFNLAQDFEDESKQAALFKALIDVAAYKYRIGNVRRYYGTAAEAFEDMADGETKNPFRLVIRKPKGHN